MNLNFKFKKKSLFLNKIILFLLLVFMLNYFSHSSFANTSFEDLNKNESDIKQSNLKFLELEKFIEQNSKSIVENQFIIIFDERGFLHTYNSIKNIAQKEKNQSSLPHMFNFFNEGIEIESSTFEKNSNNNDNNRYLVETKKIADEFIKNFTQKIHIIENLIEERNKNNNISEQADLDSFETTNLHKNSFDSQRRFSILKEHKHLFSGITVQTDIEMIEFLIEQFPDLKIIPNYKVELFISEQTRELLELNEIYNIQINDTNLTGRGIRVAVLDTGIDYTHPDFGSCSTPQECDRIADFFDFSSSNPLDIMDRQGHGTHVASTIGSNNSNAQFRGVAPEVDFYIYKVFPDIGGGGEISWIIDALERALDPTGEMNYSNSADIISMSLGVPLVNNPNFVVDLELDEIAQISIPIVAAGNSGPIFYSVASPGSSRGVITVGATTINDEIASFSSRGPTEIGTLKPDILAPGVNICAAKSSFASVNPLLNPDCQGSTQHYFNSGTSMATPIVSGTVALMLQQNASLTTREIKAILRETALDINISPAIQGWGRIQPLKAIEKMGESCIVEFNTTQLESTISTSQFEIPAAIDCNNFTHYNVYLDVLSNTGNIVSSYLLQNGTEQGDLELVINRSTIISNFALLRLESYYKSFDEEELVLSSNHDMLFTATLINQTLHPFEEISHCVSIYREGVFILDENISTSKFNKPCINIKSSNVEIQCQKSGIIYSSNSSNTSLGMLIEDASNVSVTNCNLDSFSKGIITVNSSLITISNNSFSNISQIIVELNQVSNSIIFNNDFLNNFLSNSSDINDSNSTLALYFNNSNENNTLYKNSFLSNNSINSSNWSLNEFNNFNTIIASDSTLNVSTGNYWVEHILSCEEVKNISLEGDENISVCQSPSTYFINLENNITDFTPLFNQELFDIFYIAQIVEEGKSNNKEGISSGGDDTGLIELINSLNKSVLFPSLDEPLRFNFRLPNNLFSDDNITMNWSSFNSQIISIVDNNLAIVNRSENEQNVSLELEIFRDNVTFVRYNKIFNFTIKELVTTNLSNQSGINFNTSTRNVIINDSFMDSEIVIDEEALNNISIINFTSSSNRSRVVNLNTLVENSRIQLPRNLSLTKNNIFVDFSENTQINGTNWNGELLFSNNVTINNRVIPPVADRGVSISRIIKIGSDYSRLNFSIPVRLVFKGETDKLVGFSENSVEFTYISEQCESENNFSNAISNGECYYDDGNNLIIWTTHFTEFATFNSVIIEEEPNNNNGRRSSGRGRGSLPPSAPQQDDMQEENSSSTIQEEGEEHSLEHTARNISVHENRVVTFNNEQSFVEERFTVNSQNSNFKISISSIEESTNSRISILNSQNQRTGVIILTDESDISQINFEQMEVIESKFNEKNYMIVNNVFLDDTSSKSKSLIIEQSSSDINEVCIKDAPIASISQISQDCRGEFELILSCDSQIVEERYSCTLIDGFFQIDGLRHSGVIEFKDSSYVEEVINMENEENSNNLEFIVLGGIILFSVLIITISLAHMNFHSHKNNSKNETKHKKDDVEDIVTYISKHKKLFSKRVLKEELIKAGYHKEDIDDAFKKTNK